MSLRIVRGPLSAGENAAILRHYNQLTNSTIPMSEYLHWVQEAPDGPAWHAILENNALEIVGHSALIPMRGCCAGRPVVAGKAEYAFILDEFQTATIRGFEKSGRPRNTIMIQQLFLRGQEDFSPLFISTLAASRRSLSGANRSTVTVPVSECLLILRPWRAARLTPNLRRWQRILLFLGGLLQRSAWFAMGFLFGNSGEDGKVPIGADVARSGTDRLSFFDDLKSIVWRYPEEQYERHGLGSDQNAYLIVKKGSADRYLRVCQWRLGEGQPSFQLLANLVEMARRQGALGLRWAVYGEDDVSLRLVSRIRKGGFLCARRDRTLLVHAKDEEFLSADKWNLSDSMFSFDP